MNELTRPPAKPTLWQRIKNGISHAIGYIPRGILITGVLFAASAALHGVGFDIIGVTDAAGIKGGLLTKFATHLAIGSALSGLIGATLAPCPECACEDTATHLLTAPFKLSENEKALGQQISQNAGNKLANLAQHAAADAIVPGGGTALNAALPMLQQSLGASRT